MLQQLKEDLATINRLIAAHTTAEIDNLTFGVRQLHVIYLHILHDALTVLHSLITHLER